MKKFNKITLLLIVIKFLCLNSLSAQTTSFIRSLNIGFDDVVSSATESSDGNFILSTFSINTLKPCLLKIDHSGDTILTKRDLSGDFFGEIFEIIPHLNGDDTYIGIGCLYKDNHSQNSLWIIRFDADLNLISEKKYNVPYMIGYTSSCTDHNNNLIVNGGYYDLSFGNYYDIFLFRLNSEGDSINYNHLLWPGTQYSTSIIEKLDLSGYYLPYYGRFEIQSPEVTNMAELDYNFNIVHEDSVPNCVGKNTNIRKLNANQNLISGHRFIPFTPWENEFITVEKLDADYKAYNYKTLGPLQVDTISYAAWYRNMDFIDTNNIFIGGTVNFNLFQIPGRKSYLLLAKLDSDLRNRWQYFYGFDKYYEMFGILATSDGGCLMYGTKCDYIYYATDDRDLIIIKVDANGLVTNTKKQDMVHSAILYPNPGTNYINIISGPQITGAQFTLYDMQGQSVLAEKMIGTQLRVNTAGLATGTYPWQIVYKNKVIESGKWVKE
ncbi:MAG: T9SS type A sorting domain-containing protein [Bacteroidota bacterium]